MTMPLLEQHLQEVQRANELRQPLINIAEGVIYSNGHIYARFFNDKLETVGFPKRIGGHLIKFWKLKQYKVRRHHARSVTGIVERINEAYKLAGLHRYQATVHIKQDLRPRARKKLPDIHSIIIVDTTPEAA